LADLQFVVDLEQPGQVIDKAEEKNAADDLDSDFNCADRVGFEWPFQVNPPVDGDGARQVDCIKLKCGEHGRPEAQDQVDEALVGVGLVGAVVDGVLERVVGEEIAERIEEDEIE